MKKKFAVFLMIVALLCLAGCRESDVVAHNVSREADSFNVTRRITVLNARTDVVMLQLEGVFAIKNNNANELEIICKVGEEQYKKHYVYLNEWTCYVVEDISGAEVNSYAYTLRILPEQVLTGIVDVDIGG